MPISLLVELVLFLLGAILASFAGVLAGRIYTGMPIVSGRSRCDACGQTLSGIDLIPVLALVFNRGYARCCGARISWLGPISEVVLGALFVLAYLHLGLTWTLLVVCAALVTLLALVLYDFAHSMLPPPFLAAFVVLSAIAACLSAPTLYGLGAVFLAALGISAFLALLHFGSGGRAMGLGDAPLAFGLALLSGADAISGFIFSFWIGAVIGITILATRPKGARMGVEVPFAPFLAAGFLLAYFTSWNPFTLIELLMVHLLGS